MASQSRSILESMRSEILVLSVTGAPEKPATVTTSGSGFWYKSRELLVGSSMEEALVFPNGFLQGVSRLLSGPIWGNVSLTVLVVAGALVLRWIARRAVARRFGTTEASEGGGLEEAARDDRFSAYWLRKVAGYAIWTVAAHPDPVCVGRFRWQVGHHLGWFLGGPGLRPPERHQLYSRLDHHPH